jgi:hypothetical protein
MALLASVILASALVARRNLRLDRGDRRGAARLAVFAAVLTLVAWFFDEHHVPSIWEFVLFLLAMGTSLFSAATLATYYLALEPYVRRTWPDIIVSWSRIMAGTIRDPLVARDVLFGCAAGAAQGLLRIFFSLVQHALSGVPDFFLTSDRPFLGVPHILSELSLRLFISVFLAFGLLFILFVLRLILRREWAAILAGALIFSAPFGISLGTPPAFVVFVFAGTVTIFATLARVGLVAAITMFYVSFILWNFPFAWPPTPWYSGAGFVGVAVTAAIAVAAFYVATGAGQRARLPTRATRPA